MSKKYAETIALNRLPCRVARSPRPLEVVAAELPGDIHHLADEIQARYFDAFHGLRRQRARIDPAASHFGLGIADRTGRGDLPIVQLRGDLFALLVVILIERLVLDFIMLGELGTPHIGEALGEPLRQEIAQQFFAGLLFRSEES